ncbi:MAG: tellurite methyltransferase [Crocinitomicaceae bacterium]|jgi:tellurite methyltransferase
MMTALDELRRTDIYLIDQMIKGTINKEQRILDAGCGSGRNMRYFLDHEYDIQGFDESEDQISQLKRAYSKHADKFSTSSIELYKDSEKFDFIICNAVLHFAKDHTHFDEMFKALVGLLKDDGILFIRMTSDIGLKLQYPGTSGVYYLQDRSTRYLIKRSRIDELLVEHKLQLLEPVKTVKVEELRSMTTLILKNVQKK